MPGKRFSAGCVVAANQEDAFTTGTASIKKNPGREFFAIEEQPGLSRRLRRCESQRHLIPLPDLDGGALGPDNLRVDRKTTAVAPFELTVDEAQFAASSVRGVGCGAFVIKRRKKGNISGVLRIGTQPERQAGTVLPREIQFASGQFAFFFFENLTAFEGSSGGPGCF